MKKVERSMLQGPLAGNILLFTIPVILTSYLQLLFNAADLVVVGRFCGSVSVAAVGVTGALTNLIVNLFMGLSVGAGVTVAHAIGSRNAQMVSRTVHTALLTALIGGAFLTVVGIAFSPTFLRWMDTPENVLPLSSIYMRIYFGGIVFTLVYNFCTSILRAAGDTQSPLLILLCAGVINVILNVIFVVVFHMNVAGVALATVISQAFSAAAVTIVLMNRKDDIRFYPSKMRIYRPQLEKIIRIGLPAGIQGSMFSISNVIIQSSMNSFGARHYDRVKRIFRLCMLYAGAAGLMVGGTMYLFREVMLGIYITDSAEATLIGMERMAFTSLPYFIYGFLDAAAGSLRGLGASTVSMMLSVLGICGIRLLWIGTVFQIPACHTPTCLYSSYPISWIATAIAELIAFSILYRKVQHRIE